MTLSQLEYIIAVDKERHFVKAAERCFVTQATLSMMVKKLEDELGIKIFDRTKQPIQPTKEGEQIIAHAKEVVDKAKELKAFVGDLKGEVSGELHLGVIPTLAPYFLPLFLSAFAERYKELKIVVREMLTTAILQAIHSGEIDMGLLATPLNDKGIEEYPLFYESFLAYAVNYPVASNKKYILPKDIKPDKLWLLEEGHCFRSQIFNFCELKKKTTHEEGLHYEAGSIETLVNMVDRNGGITIISQLAAMMLKPVQIQNIREFETPKPVREISLITKKYYPRKKLLQAFKACIAEHLPDAISNINPGNITPI